MLDEFNLAFGSDYDDDGVVKRAWVDGSACLYALDIELNIWTIT